MLAQDFKDRMKSLLGDEYAEFIDALENGSDVRGVRINTAKCSLDGFSAGEELKLTPLAYASDGFILGKCVGIGNTPEHHAGMIYVQDPGAMATANALDIKRGWRVLDTCSAPGGKSGQAAAKIGDSGFILSNEYVPKRAKIVVSNFERLGIKNAVVTSLDTKEFRKMFSAFFDLVIADVPCSGEGMFRKSEEAVSEWSVQNVLACAERQREIINNAAPLVKAGGYLLYSTCTFSLEENEMVIDAFLREHPDYVIVPVKDELISATSDGIQLDGAFCKNLSYARRFYPHKSEGEGQFVALLKRSEDISDDGAVLYKDGTRPLSRDEESAVRKFFLENLKKVPDGRLAKYGDNIVLISHGVPIPQRSVFSAGVLVGQVEKGRLIPAHQLFSAYGTLFIRQERLSRGDERIKKYLHGEQIDAVEVDNGYCAVIYEGAALGGGKASLGKIKNHYPKGLRT
ncbi:MAG: hypothetical protein IKV20_04590 [Clostridia bacterium]|nr:hypothetical protein [Clostridia bacterium]